MRLTTSLLLSLITALAFPFPAAAQAQKQRVLVELFTSEGCSSCAPADLLLKKLSEQQPLENIEIIALEEHVDTYNYEGWLDSFSSSDFTLRQKTYSTRFHNDTISTPQMIVDGHVQLLGDHIQEARESIREAATRPRGHFLLTPVHTSKEHRRDFEARLEPDPHPQWPIAGGVDSRLELYIAVVEKELHSKPTVGQNSGVFLAHSPVVREIYRMPFGYRGRSFYEPMPINVSVRDYWNVENLSVVVFMTGRGQVLAIGTAHISKNP
jgi:hypothetical protein